VSVCVLDEMDDDAAIEAVAAHLAAVNADVVHNHMYRAEVVGTQAAWSLAAAGRRRPFVVGTVHSSRVRSEEDRALVRALTPRMDHLVAVSRAIVRKIEDEGRTDAPISLIYNGVDLARYAEPQVCELLHAEAENGKDMMKLMSDLISYLRDLLVGKVKPDALADDLNPELQKSLEAQAASLRLGASVTFTGRRDDVPAVTAALDVAVLPSYREAQGLSILEAMALSTPVVASAVGGIPEMVEHGRTGLLVPPHDPEALAASIIRLLTDHPYADTLGRAGRDLVHERFCVELMVRAVESIYDEAVADEGRLTSGLRRAAG